MSKAPAASIIVPVYGSELYLHQCIRSVLSQTCQDFELILVDDASPDQCPQICDHYAEADPRIKVIHKENEGASLARRTGLSVSSGKYILFLDSDDWLDPETLEQCLDSVHGADCLMFSYTKEYPDRSIPNHLFDCDFQLGIEASESTIHRCLVGRIGQEMKEPHKIDNFSSLWGKFYRSEIARKGKFISERVIGTSEDTIFNLYALENCRISYLDRCLYHYRKNNMQSITSHYKKDLAEKWDTLYQLIQEYVSRSENTELYTAALLNRVACGMIGLGLNEISNPSGFLSSIRRLKDILGKPLYRRAFDALDTSHCPLKWKVFFFFCKYRMAISLDLLLHLIHYLRSRMAA